MEQFELTDVARKVVGVGSVGTRAWIALMLGRDHQDPLFLQMNARRLGAQLLRAPAARLEGFDGARADDPQGPGDVRQALRMDARRAHVRSGDRVAIVACLSNGSSFDRAILGFSTAFAVQNDRDYRLTAAVDSGKLVAETGSLSGRHR
jgi:hypothetical protein